MVESDRISKPVLKVVNPAEAPKTAVLSEEAAGNHPAQAEMPFAVVEGEPVTSLPQDLYIPPFALEVFLEAFEGPLDLLLYLIRRQNIDVLDIPIAEITRQYAEYIEMMKEVQLDLAAEYMLMAAMLAEIKSRMLLPRSEDTEEDETDPRAELIRRLLEYERFKKAAEDISQLPRMERDTFQASAEPRNRRVVGKLPDLTLKELLVAFKGAMARADMFAHLHVSREHLSVRQRMSEVLGKVRQSDFKTLSDLFSPAEGRMGVTVTFLAILELLRESLIEVVQAEAYSPIHVRAARADRVAPDKQPAD